MGNAAETDRKMLLKWHMDNKYFIECDFDFSDCESGRDVVDAVCKLLVDNFDIGHDGSYIKDLILVACSGYHKKELESEE